MTDTEIIAQLTRENLEYKNCLIEVLKSANQINNYCVCIGRPLNDNVKNYNNDQLKDFWDINNEAEFIVDLIEDVLEIKKNE